MKLSILPAASALAVALTALASSSAALAQEPPRPVMPPPGLRHDVITYEESMPNGALIGSGLTMFGVSYIPSMIVAATSDHPTDRALYVPVVGPWVNLANRDDACPNGRCRYDTANKVMLVADGLFQGLGALQIVGGFLFPTTRTVTQVAGVQVVPNVGVGQVGLTAVGAF